MRKAKKKAAKSKKKVKKQKSSEITLKAFFEQCVRLGKLMPWQRLEVEAFFKHLKLKNKEDLDTYQKALEKY